MREYPVSIVDQKTIVNIEKARKTTSISVAVLIARALGVNLEQLTIDNG